MGGGHVNKTKLSMDKLYILKLDYGHIGVRSTILSFHFYMFEIFPNNQGKQKEYYV